MDAKIGIHPKIVQSLTSAPREALIAASVHVAQTLAGDVAAGDGDHNPVLLDSLSFLFAFALQQSMSPAAFEEYLTAGSSLRSDIVLQLVCVHRDHCWQHHTAGVFDGARVVFEDGFFTRLTGVSWSLHHALGDRMQDPPSPSLPHFELAWSVEQPATRTTDVFRTRVPAERLVDLHSTLKQMLKEAERVARENSI